MFGIEYFYIDKNGKQIITTVNNEKLKRVSSFSQGLATVETKFNSGKTYAINKNGAIIENAIAPQIKKSDFNLYPDKEANQSLGIVDKAIGAPLAVTGLWGYKNKNGSWVIAPKYAGAGNFTYTYFDKGETSVTENIYAQSKQDSIPKENIFIKEELTLISGRYSDDGGTFVFKNEKGDEMTASQLPEENSVEFSDNVVQRKYINKKYLIKYLMKTIHHEASNSDNVEMVIEEMTTVEETED